MANKKTGGVELELRRDLGFFDITMIGIGAMIGAGIFVLTGYAIGGAGPAAIVVFVLNGIVAIMTALTYMELGSCFPEAGGGYLWVREGMPHPFGFLSGWMSWMAHTVACSLYALGFGSYLTWLFEEYGWNILGATDVVAKLFAVIVAIILLSVNYMGTGATGKTENIVTIAKLITLFIFIGFGIFAFMHNADAVGNFTNNFMPEGFGGIAYGMGLTFIAFQGFEVIAQCGEEVKNPRKNIPKAIIVSLVVVIIIYIAIAFIVIGNVNGGFLLDEQGNRVLDEAGAPIYKEGFEIIGDHGELAMVEAAKTFMGPIGFFIMIIGGLVSTVSALNATVFSSSRVSFAMGRDGTLPESLGRIHPKRRTPSNAIMLTGVIMIIMAVTLPIEDVAASADIMFLLLFSFANISLITLRQKMPYLQRGFVVPLVPFIPIVATVLNLALAIYLFFHSPVSWYIAIVWIEFGLIAYYFTRGKEEITEIEKVEKLVGMARRETGKNYHVLVPIANPRNTELIDFASTVAKHRDGDMILLNIAAIPDTIPIKNVDYEFVNRRVNTAKELSDYSAGKFNIITRARVVVSHKVRDTILDVVKKEKANITFIGWSGKPSSRRIMFGYNIDDIIQYAKSDVVVLKGPIKEKINRILLLPGFEHHGDRSAEIAAFVAKDHNATITVVGLVTPDKSEIEISSETRRISEIIRKIGARVEEHVIRTKRPIAKVTEMTANHEFLIMGASEKWKLLRYAFGPLPDSIAKKVNIPLLMLRAYEKEETLLSTSLLGEGKEAKEPKPKSEKSKTIIEPLPEPEDDKEDKKETAPVAEPVSAVQVQEPEKAEKADTVTEMPPEEAEEGEPGESGGGGGATAGSGTKDDTGTGDITDVHGTDTDKKGSSVPDELSDEKSPNNVKSTPAPDIETHELDEAEPDDSIEPQANGATKIMEHEPNSLQPEHQERPVHDSDIDTDMGGDSATGPQEPGINNSLSGLDRGDDHD